MSKELLECPFCGKDEAQLIGIDCCYSVECLYIHCGVTTCDYSNKDDAIERWNSRSYKKIKSGAQLTEEEIEMLNDARRTLRNSLDALDKIMHLL